MEPKSVHWHWSFSCWSTIRCRSEEIRNPSKLLRSPERILLLQGRRNKFPVSESWKINLVFNNKIIQTIYCDFNQSNANSNAVKATMASTNQRNSSVCPEFSEFCKGLQSQPCKVLYSDYPDIHLFDFNKHKNSTNVSLKN